MTEAKNKRYRNPKRNKAARIERRDRGITQNFRFDKDCGRTTDGSNGLKRGGCDQAELKMVVESGILDDLRSSSTFFLFASGLVSEKVDETSSLTISDRQKFVFEGVQLSEETRTDERRAEKWYDGEEESVQHQNRNDGWNLGIDFWIRSLEPSGNDGCDSIGCKEKKVLSVCDSQGKVGDVFMEDSTHDKSSHGSSSLWQKAPFWLA